MFRQDMLDFYRHSVFTRAGTETPTTAIPAHSRA